MVSDTAAIALNWVLVVAAGTVPEMMLGTDWGKICMSDVSRVNTISP